MLQLDSVQFSDKEFASTRPSTNDKHIIRLNAASLSEAPLTPASRSFHGANSDRSETDSGETVPSSVAENGTQQNASNFLKAIIKPDVSPKTSVPSLEENPQSSKQPHRLVDDPFPLSHTSPKQNEDQKEQPFINEGLVSRPAIDPRDPIQMRRHTSPPATCRLKDPNVTSALTTPIISKNRDKNMGFGESEVCNTSQAIPPYVRSNTSVDIQRLHKNPTQDSFSNEISRMRNLIILKRNLQKQRKNTNDDDDVFIGKKISEGHENFVMAYNMLTGIRVAVSRCSGVMKQLTSEDFKTTKKLTFNMDGNELTPSSKYDFKFKDYCPEVFRELRGLFGIDPADYLISITGKYILSELGSPGKSGSFFYYSRDFRFIIKTIHHSEHKQLRKILKDYYSHVKQNPNTLISQFYGLHRLKVHGGIKKIHFLVMNNLFPPHRDIHFKYDLKGSTWGRYAKIPIPTKGESDLSHLTLKDLNWLERHETIHFGPQKRSTFLQQLTADVEFLKRINVMDYSLLLGIHDVSQGNSSRISKLSVFDPKSNAKSDLMKTNPRDIDRRMDLPSHVFPGRSKYIFYGHDGGIRGTDEDNEPVSVIYYLGVIDCLTNYSLRKRLETFWRSLNHSRRTVSAIPADEYGDRFLQFISNTVSHNNSKAD